MAETTVTISMRRSDGNTPWGFRIQGGQEFGTSLSIAGVQQGSLSDRAGLQVGDRLSQLQGAQCAGMSHKQGQDIVASATSSLDLVVARLGSGSALSTAPWAGMTSSKESSHVTQSRDITNYQAANRVNTSIQQHRHSEQNRIPGYNVSASPWGGPQTQPPSQPALKPYTPPAAAPPPVPKSAPPQQLSPRAPAAPPSQSTQKVIHAQYNSPAGLYSAKSTAEEYLHQTGGLFGTDPSLQAKEEPSYLRSETLRLIQESEHGGGRQQQQHMGRRSPIPGYAEGREHTLHESDANLQSGSFKRLSHALGSDVASDQNEEKVTQSVSSRVASYQQSITEGHVPQGFGGGQPAAGDEHAPACDGCGRSILGVYCKAAGRSLHPECFNCATCGTNLKNIGYFNVNDKLYCETHARQLQGPILGPKPAIDPNAFNPASYPMPVNTRSMDPPRAFYQPEILKPGPLGKINPPAAPWRGSGGPGGPSSLSPSSRGIPSAPSMYAAPPTDYSMSGFNQSYSTSFKSTTLGSSQQNGISSVAPPAPAPQPKPAPPPPSAAPFSAAPPQMSAPFSSAPPPIEEEERAEVKSEYDVPTGITQHGIAIEQQEQQYHEQVQQLYNQTLEQQGPVAQNQSTWQPVHQVQDQRHTLQEPEIKQDFLQRAEEQKQVDESEFYADPSSSGAYIVLESPLPFRAASSAAQVYEHVDNPYKSELLDMIQKDDEQAELIKKGEYVIPQQPTWHPPPLKPPTGGRPERRNSITNIQWPPQDTKEFVPSWRLQSLNGQERTFGADGSYGIRPGDPDYLKVIWYRKSQHIKEKDKRPPSPLRELMRRDAKRASLPPNLRSKHGPPKFGSSQLTGLGVKTEPQRGVPNDAYGPFIPADQPEPQGNLSPKLKLQMSREQYADRVQELGFQQKQVDENFGTEDNEETRSKITVMLQNSEDLNAQAENLIDATCEAVQEELQMIQGQLQQQQQEVLQQNIREEVKESIVERNQAIDNTVDALMHLAKDIDDVALKLSNKTQTNQEASKASKFAQNSPVPQHGLYSTVNAENVMPVFAPRSYNRSGAWAQAKQDSLDSTEVAMTMRRETEVIQQGEDQIVRQITHQSIRPTQPPHQHHQGQEWDTPKKRTTETQSQLQGTGEERATIPATAHSPADIIQIRLNEQIHPGSGAKWTPNAESGGRTSGAVQPKRGRGILKQSHDVPRIPVCEACHREIRGPFILAMNKTWDPDCFACANAQCRRRLQDIGFVEENGQNYCEVCFENYLAPQCAKCFKPVTGDCLNALDRQWHPECFACAHCGKVFGNSAFYLEEGKAYCETDWNNLFTTKCVSCEFAIEAGDRWVEALGHAYHSECFQCTTCSKPLEGQSFYAKAGHPYCKTHA